TGWLAQRMERPGTVLFAVGAGHLAGRDSVQSMLAARGIQARRID
ncbi:MAG TPA: TraB/GumN family protein, partial [Allosphingosinicella sp.]